MTVIFGQAWLAPDKSNRGSVLARFANTPALSFSQTAVCLPSAQLAVAARGCTASSLAGNTELAEPAATAVPRGNSQSFHPSAAGRVIAVADAQLVNRAELLRGLTPQVQPIAGDSGSVFRGGSSGTNDAEVLRLIYLRHGISGFSQVAGEFACLLWDDDRGQLVAAVDPLGLRPLFYRPQAGGVCCGSMIRQLADAGLSQAPLNDARLARFLSGGPLDVGSTFYAGIHRVPPGCAVTFSQGQPPRTVRYWHPAQLAEHANISVRGRDLAAEFHERFQQSLADRVAAGSTRLGVHVSGGLDSAAVAAMLHHARQRGQHGAELLAIRATAEHAAADERQFADRVTDAFSMDTLSVRCEDHWGFRSAPAVDAWLDEPHQSAYLSRSLAELERAASLGITQIFGGEGGDELGASSFYLVDRLWRGRILGTRKELRLRAQARGLSSHALALALVQMSIGRWLRRKVRRAAPPWISPVWVQATESRRPENSSGQMDPPGFWNPARADLWQRVSSLWETPSFSQCRALYEAIGAEVIHPFLDKRLVEWALTVPPAAQGAGGQVKAIMRQALADILPAEIRARSTKGNYVWYFDLGLRERERPRIETLFANSRLAALGMIDAAQLQSAYANYVAGNNANRTFLGRTLAAEEWLRRREE